MAQTGYTPILIYASGTTGNTPSAANMTSSASGAELALNYFDGKLFYKDASGVVQVLAGKGGTGVVAGSNTQIQFNNNGVFGAAAGLTWDGTYLTANSIKDSALTSGRVTYAGASGLLQDSANLTFDGTTLTANALTVTNATTLNGGTANGVAYLNASKVLTTGSLLTFDGTTFVNAVGSIQVPSTATFKFGAGFTNYIQGDTTSNYLLFATNSAEQMRLTSSLLSVVPGATIQGLTVGRGAGAVSTNTAVGASALAANTTGSENVAVGANTLQANTTGTTNLAAGRTALGSNTTGSNNAATGYLALGSNTTGGNNTASGAYALYANTTASGNTAVGFQAGYGNTTGASNTAVGIYALGSNTTGNDNTAIGASGTLYFNTTGNSNVAVGNNALRSNTTPSYNTAVGYQAGYGANSGFSTLLGYQAGYQAANGGIVAVGYQAGYNGGTQGVYVGVQAGYATTGGFNTFVGAQGSGGAGSGSAITTGTRNTILGSYSGNQGGLDLRTANNYIVLSDGDGNPRLIGSNEGSFGLGTPPQTGWTTEFKAFQIGYAVFAPYTTSNANFAYNWYYGPGGDKYMQNGYSVLMQLNGKNAGDFTVRATGNNTSGAGASLTFTDVLSVQKDTSVALQGATVKSGTGITFPATQNASSDANTLDDYEEGTWTPGLSGSFSYTSRNGKYTKIGNTVTVTGDIIWASNSSGSTSWAVTGLPFTVSDNRVPATLGYMAGVDNIGGKQIIATTSSGQTSFDFWAINDNATPTNIDAANISSTGEVQFCIVYHTST